VNQGIAVRDNTPRSLWRGGDFDAANQILTEQFKAFLRTMNDAPIRGDIFTLEFAQMLLHRGFFDQACRLLKRVRDPESNIAHHFYLLDKVAQFCLSQASTPSDMPTSEPLFAVLPIWGEHYLNTWERLGLPSWTDEAASSLYDGRRFEFLVFTSSEDRTRLLAMPGMRKLAQLATVRFFNLDVILKEHGRRNMDGMNIAHWSALTLAKKKRASVVLLFADTLYARGSLGGLDKAIRHGTHDILFTIDLQLAHEAWTSSTFGGEWPTRPCEISNQELARLFIHYPAIRERAWRLNVETGHAPLRPFRLSRGTDVGAELRTFLPQPIYISRELVPEIFAQTPTGLDLSAVESSWVALGSAERMRVLNDPSEFLCATIDAANETIGSENPWSTMVESQDVATYTLENLARRGLLSPARQWAFSNPLKINQTDTDEHFAAMQEKIDDFRGGRCMSHIDYLRFVKDVALPVFDRLTHAK
jgi:hypothetical protein